MALIPPFFTDTVVAIGVDREGRREWIASGFLYGWFIGGEGDKRRYRVYLVTNRHVVEGSSVIYLRFNPQTDEPAREYPLPLTDEDGTGRWLGHPKNAIDVAVVPININLLKEHAMQVEFFANDVHAATIDRMREFGLTEGDFAYVLGFPMGLVGEQRNTVIVRSGSIARIRDALAKAGEEFLVDAFVFPGNSGGPVILKPEILSVEGTKSVSTAYLIGVVRAYVPYRDLSFASWGSSLSTSQPAHDFFDDLTVRISNTARGSTLATIHDDWPSYCAKVRNTGRGPQ